MSLQPMQQFVDELEARLDAAAAREHARGPIGRAGRFVASRPAGTTIGTIVAIAATVAVALGVSAGPGTSEALALPVLERESVDLTRDSDRYVQFVRVGGRLRSAKPFAAAGGTGYFIPGPSSCLTLPDPATDHPQEEYGSTCRSLALVEREGLSIAMVGAGRAYYAAVVPARVPAPVLRFDDGSTRTLVVHTGIATATLDESATVIEHHVDGSVREIPLRLAGSGSPNACGADAVGFQFRPCAPAPPVAPSTPSSGTKDSATPPGETPRRTGNRPDPLPGRP